MLSRSGIFALLLLAVCVLSGNAFRPTSRMLTRTTPPTTLQAVDANLLLLANAADGYGQVNAPGWALPAGAFFVILLAGIPALLAPGEKVSISG